MTDVDITTEKNTGKNSGIANLTPWQPGQSGNPNGRPKKEFCLTDGLREYIAETDPVLKRERKDLLVEKTYELALKGDLAAIREIWDRLEGKPKGDAPIIPIQVNNYFGVDTMEQAFPIWLQDALEDKIVIDDGVSVQVRPGCVKAISDNWDKIIRLRGE